MSAFFTGGRNAGAAVARVVHAHDGGVLDAADAGVGFDLYFPLFKFSPELRFSKGLLNVIGDDASVFKEPLSRLNTNTIQVYLIFQ